MHNLGISSPDRLNSGQKRRIVLHKGRGGLLCGGLKFSRESLLNGLYFRAGEIAKHFLLLDIDNGQ